MLAHHWIHAQCLRYLIPIATLFMTSSCFADSFLEIIDTAKNFRNCYLTNNGSTSTATVTFDYLKKEKYTPAEGQFYSRSILFYTYDINGVPNSGQTAGPVKVYMNGVAGSFDRGWPLYSIYSNVNTSWWKNTDAFTATIGIIIPNSILNTWPAVSIRPGNIASRSGSTEVAGGVYLQETSNGTCTLVEPGDKQQQVSNISMEAPEWALGEIPRASSTLTLRKDSDQLCITYTAAEEHIPFKISAQSQNGIFNNSFRLTNLINPAQSIPYTLRLRGSRSELEFPNQNSYITFDSGGKTCFVPTFNIKADKNTMPGDYIDVLTFNISTPS